MFLSLLLRGLTNDGLPLPSVPDVVLRIQRVLDDREAEIDPLVRAIAREPAVAVKLVGVANSSLYGGTHPARGLKSAVMRIGFRETRNVVLAILARGRLFRVPGFEREAEELHRLALATSLATQLLARERGLDQDEAFFAGLVHDLGRTVLYALAAEVRRQTRGCLSPTAGAVTTVSAALHEELGALVAETWGAGPTLVAAIRFHHCPQRAPLAARPLAEALCTAADIARGISPAREIFADEPPPPPRPAPARVVERTRAQLLALERSLSPPAAAAHLS